MTPMDTTHPEAFAWHIEYANIMDKLGCPSVIAAESIQESNRMAVG